MGMERCRRLAGQAKKIPQELADNARELATINLALQIRNAHQQDELARYCALLSEGKPLREQRR
ncbi:hypothetical protein [Pectobacterium carotovorum]|uniref:hypothetical protein n=1 Tax=Pectobacterium carotovorum TaxID=554 RepID=UPI001F3267CE|nr:hypothetical protein [Pectobacterium carotovorum]